MLNARIARMKIITVLLLFICPFIVLGQEVSDVVEMGASYENEVYYDLERGFVKKNARSDWDLALSSNTMSASVLINDGADVQLFLLSERAEDWSKVDTLGKMQMPLYNSDSTWEIGAFNKLSKGVFDYGWADYNKTSHDLVGKFIYAIVLRDKSVKKIFIEYMKAKGDVQLKIANLDGSEEQSFSFTKIDFKTNDYAFLSLNDGKFAALQPDRETWDLLFTKYMSEVSMGPTTAYYPVTGVKHANHVEVAQRDNIPTDNDDYSGASASSNITTIGSDWKNFNRGTFQYELVEDRTYFVKSKGNVWKLYFTSFEGSSTGKIGFNKKLVKSASIEEPNQIFTIYPNPSSGNIHIVSDLEQNRDLVLELFDLQGRLVWTAAHNAKTGFRDVQVDLPVPTGIYNLRVSSNLGVQNTRLIVE